MSDQFDVRDKEFGVVELWVYALLSLAVGSALLWFGAMELATSWTAATCKERLFGFVYFISLISIYFGLGLLRHMLSTARFVLRARQGTGSEGLLLTLGYGRRIHVGAGDVESVTGRRSYLFAQTRLPLGRGGWYSEVALRRGKRLYVSHAMAGAETLIERLQRMAEGHSA